MPKPKRKRLSKIGRRARFSWYPEWDSEIKGWTINYIHENKWRCEKAVNDFDDLLQDAYIIFERVKDTYPLCASPSHFMSLYKTSFRNFIWDKSRKQDHFITYIDSSLDAYDLETIGDTSNYGELSILIKNGPPEIKMFIDALHDNEFLEKLRNFNDTLPGRQRANLNTKISKLLGIENYPFVTKLKELLT